MSEGIDYILDQVGPDIMGPAYKPRRKKARGGIEYILEQVTPDIMGTNNTASAISDYSPAKGMNTAGEASMNKAETLADNVLGAVTQFDKGGSFGFGRKIGGAMNAVFAAPIDSLLTKKTLSQAFSDRYNEINDTALKSATRFENEHPIAATGLQIGGAFVNPLNKIGAGYIANGKGFANTLARSGLVGLENGTLAGLGRSETIGDIVRNVRDDAVGGAVLGAAFPLAVKSAQMFGRQVFPLAKNKVQNIWQQNAGRQLDVEQAAANQKNRYNDFLTANAEKEVFDAIPNDKVVHMVEIPENAVPDFQSKPELRRWLQDKFRKMGKVKIESTGEEVSFPNSAARRIIKNARNMINNIVYPEIDNVVAKGNYVGTKNVDVRHLGKVDGQNIYLSGMKFKGEPYKIEFYVDRPLVTKDRNFAGHKVKKIEPERQRHSFEAVANGSKDPQRSDPLYTLADLRENVNPSLPNISTIERGFTDFQKKAFYDAMAQAVERSSGKVGSLETTQIMQDAIDDMLKKSYKLSEVEKKRPTAESLQLYELKAKLNELMKPTGIDKYQAGLAKADALQSAYHRGYGSASSGGTAGGLSFGSLRDRRAFLQGRLANHLHKAKDGHDLAAKIVADKETFRSLMPPKNYENLMREITKINAESGDSLYRLVPYLVQLLGE